MSGSGRWPLPIFVALRDVPVTVVGAGTIAERKIGGFLDAGARVTVVAPEATSAILGWAAAGRLEFRQRPYRAGDLRGARLAYAATSLQDVNRAVRVEARAEGVWLNAVDQPDLCDFITPALVRRGALTHRHFHRRPRARLRQESEAGTRAPHRARVRTEAGGRGARARRGRTHWRERRGRGRWTSGSGTLRLRTRLGRPRGRRPWGSRICSR